MGVDSVLEPGLPFLDLAYGMLHNEGSPLYYRELFARVLALKGEDIAQLGPEQIAALYTDFNLDHRFHHVGEGEWGLLEWQPRAKSRVVVVAQAPKARPERRIESMDDLGLAVVEEGEPAEANEENEEEWD